MLDENGPNEACTKKKKNIIRRECVIDDQSEVVSRKSTLETASDIVNVLGNRDLDSNFQEDQLIQSSSINNICKPVSTHQHLSQASTVVNVPTSTSTDIMTTSQTSMPSTTPVNTMDADVDEMTLSQKNSLEKENSEKNLLRTVDKSKDCANEGLSTSMESQDETEKLLRQNRELKQQIEAQKILAENQALKKQLEDFKRQDAKTYTHVQMPLEDHSQNDQEKNKNIRVNRYEIPIEDILESDKPKPESERTSKKTMEKNQDTANPTLVNATRSNESSYGSSDIPASISSATENQQEPTTPLDKNTNGSTYIRGEEVRIIEGDNSGCFGNLIRIRSSRKFRMDQDGYFAVNIYLQDESKQAFWVPPEAVLPVLSVGTKIVLKGLSDEKYNGVDATITGYYDLGNDRYHVTLNDGEQIGVHPANMVVTSSNKNNLNEDLYFKCEPAKGFDGVSIRNSMHLEDRTGKMIKRGNIVKAALVLGQWIWLGGRQFVPCFINDKKIFKKRNFRSVSFMPKRFGIGYQGNIITEITPGGQADLLNVCVGWTIVFINGVNVPNETDIVSEAIDRSKDANQSTTIVFNPYGNNMSDNTLSMPTTGSLSKVRCAYMEGMTILCVSGPEGSAYTQARELAALLQEKNADEFHVWCFSPDKASYIEWLAVFKADTEGEWENDASTLCWIETHKFGNVIVDVKGGLTDFCEWLVEAYPKSKAAELANKIRLSSGITSSNKIVTQHEKKKAHIIILL